MWAGTAGGYNSHGRFVDNGHDVGHDEPTVRLISSAPGSGNTMFWTLTSKAGQSIGHLFPPRRQAGARPTSS
ncbi:MAG TPA: hypothetical protein VMU94_14650 [Streptosporangiaceae bacterium]|nr:hypothetical protein [Streptosporangiaceae bacterium]